MRPTRSWKPHPATMSSTEGPTLSTTRGTAQDHGNEAFAIGHLDVDGLRLRYALRSGHGTPLLLCNGIGANLELALPLAREIPARPLVVVDLPGTGGSSASCFWPSMGRYARMLVQVMDQLGFRDHFAVGGVSWGGALAQRIARDQPARVTHLILLATSPGIFMVPGRPSALLRMLTPQRYLSSDYMTRHAGTLYGGEMRHRPARAREHAAQMRAPSALSYLQQVLAMYQFSSLPWLHRLRCPTLVLSGDDDPLVRPVNARILAGLLPRARLEIIKGGGHLFLTQQAHQTAALIDGFLAE